MLYLELFSESENFEIFLKNSEIYLKNGQKFVRLGRSLRVEILHKHALEVSA
jgi:hypothetical protein